MIHRVVHVVNELGLHARAAARLTKLTSQFESKVKLSRRFNNQEINGKSILGILLLAAARGTELEVTVDGPDEELAMKEIVGLFEDRFGEDR